MSEPHSSDNQHPDSGLDPSSGTSSTGSTGAGGKPETLIEDLVERVLEVLGQVLPASTLKRFGEQISPTVDAVLAPFQILRRDDFEGYLAQLDRLENEVSDLREQLEELQKT